MKSLSLYLLLGTALQLYKTCVGVDIYQREENDTSSISWIVRGVATVTVGLSSYFDCVAETGSVTTTLQWSAMNGFAAGVSVSSLSNGQRLEFPRVQDSHVGVYTCRDVEHGEDITLTITTDNPAIRAAEPMVTARQGETVNLEIYTSGNPPPSGGMITWRRNNVVVSNNLFDVKHRLKIDNVQLSDAGTYNVSITVLISAIQGLTRTKFTLLMLKVIVPLEVVAHPMNITANEWTTKWLECRVSGVPSPTTISWTASGHGVVSTNITGSEVVSRLTFSSIRVADVGQYRCVAINDHDNITSQPATVTVNPRLLLSQVINSDVISVDTLLTVQEVQTVVLSCRSSNTPRWYNGTDLISSISSDPVYQTSVNRSTKFLRIRAYTNSDKGQYTCRDTVNSIQLERSISLTTVNPSVFSNITLLYPLVGTSVTIWVQVSGNPVPQPGDIKWYRNDVLINDEDSSLTLSQDHTTLIINNIMGDYYGIYRCRVSTSAGTRYHNVTITQPRAAQARINLEQPFALVGESVHLTCLVSGTPERMMYWKYNGSPTLPSGAVVDNDVLGISSVQLSHTGNYTCVVSNPVNIDEDTVELIAVEPPAVSIRVNAVLVHPQTGPIIQKASSGPPQILCGTTGTPTPSIHWLYNDGPLPDGIHTTPDSSSLMWSRAMTYTDSGVYHCVATNPGGTANSSVELVVNVVAMVRTILPHLPTIGDTSSSNNYVTPIGQTGTVISCVAVGSPPPHVSWVSYNGAPLPGHVRSVRSSSGSHDPNQVVTDLYWSQSFSSGDVGVYRCEARNSAGNNTIDATISVATDTPATPAPSATPPVDSSELFVQLRILGLDCSQWKVSERLENFTLDQIHNTIFSGLELQCSCILSDNVLSSLGLSCSEVVTDSTLYRGRLVTVGNNTASEVYSVLSSWTSSVPSIVVNNVQHKVDTNCDLLIESLTDQECGVEDTSSPPTGDNDESNNILLYAVIGVAAVLLVCIILVIVVMFAWRKYKRSDHHKFSRRFSLKARVRGGSGVYVSNSFQGQLNSLGQGTITEPTVHVHNPGFAASSIAEEQSIDTPVEQQNGQAPVENHYDLPNNPRRFVQVQRSPRLSSESRVTTDSGIQSRAHSCDRLMAAVGDVASPPLRSPHRLLGHSRSAEIDLSQSREGSAVFVESPRIPMKHRQPSFDEMHYLANVEYYDDESKECRPPPYYTESHSQPLETLEYISPQPSQIRHNYVFTDQDTSSQSYGLSQSFPSASHFQQSKTHPEPYVEPVSLRSSLHSILTQNSQLDTMV